jgi:hypothetical protein
MKGCIFSRNMWRVVMIVGSRVKTSDVQPKHDGGLLNLESRCHSPWALSKPAQAILKDSKYVACGCGDLFQDDLAACLHVPSAVPSSAIDHSHTSTR